MRDFSLKDGGRIRERLLGDRTFAQWTAEFDAETSAHEAELASHIETNVFQAAFDALKQRLGK